MCGPSWMRRSARLCISCCASVLATTNSTPCKFKAIMLSTALVPPPPTPITVIRGVKPVCTWCGMVRFSVMRASPRGESNRWLICEAGMASIREASDALLDEIYEAAEQAGRLHDLQIDILHSAAFTSGPVQHAGRGGEGGT